MDNLELYRVALNGVPYVAAAYGLLWVTLVIFIGLVLRRVSKLEREIEVLEESVERRNG